jgi:hypothetical protein
VEDIVLSLYEGGVEGKFSAFKNNVTFQTTCLDFDGFFQLGMKGKHTIIVKPIV